jgi:hypothetical protein
LISAGLWSRKRAFSASAVIARLSLIDYALVAEMDVGELGVRVHKVG